jgi:transposase
MNWEKLIPILENACKKVESIKDIDERLAELIFIVAEIVEETEREACAKLCETLVMGKHCAAAIRSREDA